jgi:hypothetical protein
MKKWENDEGKMVFYRYLSRIMEKETLVSRFIEIRENISEIYRFSDNFMRKALNFTEINLKTRTVLKKAAEVFGVYLKINNILFPAEGIGCQLLGNFGVYAKSLCLYYTEEMHAIDMSTRKHIKKKRFPFYYDPLKKTSIGFRYNQFEPSKKTSVKTDQSQISNLIRYFDDLSVIPSNQNSFEINISVIQSTCNRHPQNLIQSTCTNRHCIQCLYETIQSGESFISCGCGAEISEKDKKMIIEIFESQLKSRDFQRIEDNQEDLHVDQCTTEEVKNELPQVEKKEILDYQKSTPPPLIKKKISGIYFEKKMICFYCKVESYESEFQIHCNCRSILEVTMICIACRAKVIEKCVICNQNYSFFTKVALEIYNLTKCAKLIKNKKK